MTKNVLFDRDKHDENDDDDDDESEETDDRIVAVVSYTDDKDISIKVCLLYIKLYTLMFAFLYIVDHRFISLPMN